MRQPDPLAGYREAINAGECDVLTWRDTGEGSPVKVGDTFKLRACSIEIRSLRRNGRGQVWHWVATFERFVRAEKLYLLTPGAGDGHGYTTSPERAHRSGEEAEANPSPAEMAAGLAADVRDVRHPPEPEAVPPHEVRNLPTSIAARARYESERHDAIEKRLDRSLTGQLKELRIRARATGVDISNEMTEILDLADRAMAKVKRAA